MQQLESCLYDHIFVFYSIITVILRGGRDLPFRFLWGHLSGDIFVVTAGWGEPLLAPSR